MNQKTPSSDELTQQLIDFRDARNWRQFHALKDLIVSVSLEASELVELTQWKSTQAVEDEAQQEPMQQRLREECADVYLYLLLVAERAGFDLQQAAADKIKANAVKYPVDKAYGKSTKYNKL